MKTLKTLFLAMALLATYTLTAQVAVTSDGSSADGSAMLDVKSTDKGFLLPRLSETQIQTIESPANGLMVYNTDNGKSYIFIQSDNEWKEIKYGAGTIAGPFTCGDDLVDSRDSKSYSTVLFGTQCWMAEYLNVGDMIHSTSGGTNSDGEQTDNSSIEKYCYNNNTTNCNTYGGLYQWAEAMQYLTTEGIQGICPEGWHLPTDAEWTTLTNYISSQPEYLCNSNADNIAKAVAATTNWNTHTNTCAIGNDLGANNATGFTGLPGGYRTTNGDFDNIGNGANWWSSTDYSTTDALKRGMFYTGATVNPNHFAKACGFSVRCLKD